MPYTVCAPDPRLCATGRSCSIGAWSACSAVPIGTVLVCAASPAFLFLRDPKQPSNGHRNPQQPLATLVLENSGSRNCRSQSTARYLRCTIWPCTGSPLLSVLARRGCRHCLGPRYLVVTPLPGTSVIHSQALRAGFSGCASVVLRSSLLLATSSQ